MSHVNAVIRKYIGFAKYVYQRRDGESVQNRPLLPCEARTV